MSTTKKKPSSRDGKKFVGGYFYVPIHTEIKVIAAKEGKTTQDLAAEAYTMLFQSRGIEIVVK